MTRTLTGTASLVRTSGNIPTLYRVKHRFEMGTLVTEEPEVTRMEPMIYTPMTEAIQWMAFDLLFWDYRQGDRSYITADEKRIFTVVYKGDTFITNGQGLENHRNYITGERMDQPLPGFMSLVMGGALITGTELISAGVAALQVRTLTGAVPARDIAPCPWLRQHATICTTKDLGDGTYQVNPFTQRGGREGAPVIVPLLARYPVSIPLSKLVKLPPGAPLPSPYVPPW